MNDRAAWSLRALPAPAKGRGPLDPACAWHGTDLGGESPLRAVTTGIVSPRQLRRREAGWGGSRRQNPERTNRNRISGRCDGVSPHGRVRPDSRSDIALVNPAAPGGKIRVLPREVSSGLGAIPSRSAATATDARGEVSRGHSSRPRRLVKGRIFWCKEQSRQTR